MKTTIPEELGEAIASLRGRRSQTEAARRGGISRASWSLYEQGKRVPRKDSLAKVVKGLGCTKDQLEETVRRVHRRRLLEEALDLGEWPAELLPPQGRSLPGRHGARRPQGLPPELRAILDRHVASLEEAFAFLLRKGA